MTMNDLCSMNQCRIVHFMEHDRVVWRPDHEHGGFNVASAPLRRGKGWAWWTLLISGLVGSPAS
jgi:hypothetical protein